MSAAMTTMMISCEQGSRLTADQMQGKRMYESLCDKCHKLIPPKNLTDDAWSLAVERYGPKLQLRQDELRLLKAYLTRANDQDF
ncbi:MAG: hypothetical protein AB1644_03370 [Candidatus Zixiibacteriota bacterium]